MHIAKWRESNDMLNGHILSSYKLPIYGKNPVLVNAGYLWKEEEREREIVFNIFWYKIMCSAI